MNFTIKIDLQECMQALECATVHNQNVRVVDVAIAVAGLRPLLIAAMIVSRNEVMYIVVVTVGNNVVPSWSS